MSGKRLHKSQDRVLAGVCGGLAEYLGWDITTVRVCYTLLTFFTAFSGAIVYMVLMLLMPEE